MCVTVFFGRGKNNRACLPCDSDGMFAVCTRHDDKLKIARRIQVICRWRQRTRRCLPNSQRHHSPHQIDRIDGIQSHNTCSWRRRRAKKGTHHWHWQTVTKLNFDIVWFFLAKAFAFRFCKRKIQQPPLSKVKLRLQLASLILFFIVLPPPPTTYSTLKFYFHFYHVIQY